VGSATGPLCGTGNGSFITINSTSRAETIRYSFHQKDIRSLPPGARGDDRPGRECLFTVGNHGRVQEDSLPFSKRTTPRRDLREFPRGWGSISGKRQPVCALTPQRTQAELISSSISRSSRSDSAREWGSWNEGSAARQTPQPKSSQPS